MTEQCCQCDCKAHIEWGGFWYCLPCYEQATGGFEPDRFFREQEEQGEI